jgi:hypothetical protein
MSAVGVVCYQFLNEKFPDEMIGKIGLFLWSQSAKFRQKTFKLSRLYETTIYEN